MSYAALKAELALPAYSGLSNAAAAAALLAAPAQTFVDVDPQDWLDTLVNSGDYGRIDLAADLPPSATVLSSPTPQDITVARLRTFIKALNSERSIRTSRSAVRNTYGSLIDAMAAGGLISAPTATALKAFAVVNTNRAAQLGFPEMSDQIIAAARIWNG